MHKLRHFVCAVCGLSFPRHRTTAQYCSRGCAYTGHALNAQVMKQCYTCGKRCTRKKSTIRESKRYCCSHACQRKAGKYHLSERFWPLVDQRGIEACWPWLGARNAAGYGVFALQRGKNRPAHVIAWELTYGPFPQGKQGNHTCDTYGCCNPHHIYPGTQAENLEDTRWAQRHAGRPAKLTLHQIQEIRNLLGTMKQNDIAALYQVTPGTISAIKHHTLRVDYSTQQPQPARTARMSGLQMLLTIRSFIDVR